MRKFIPDTIRVRVNRHLVNPDDAVPFSIHSRITTYYELKKNGEGPHTFCGPVYNGFRPYVDILFLDKGETWNGFFLVEETFGWEEL